MLGRGTILLAAWTVGCGATSFGVFGIDGGSDGGTDAGTVCVPEKHQPFPQVLTQGGPVLGSPELVTITFAGYDLESEVQRFGDWVVGPNWLPVVGAEYGVGSGSHWDKVVLKGAAPSAVLDTEIAEFLDEKARMSAIPQPSAAHPNLLYVIYYPSSTVLRRDRMGTISATSCTVGGFGGFHTEGLVDGVEVPIAVVPECTDLANRMDLPLRDVVEVAASHEIFEAATDPFPHTAPAFRLAGGDPWGALGSELGDLCLGSLAPTTPEGFRVQRMWSNAAAKQGGPPCLPASEEAYFNVSPSPGGPLKIAAGQAADVEVRGWSTVSGTTWRVGIVAGGDFEPSFTAPLLGRWAMSDCTSIDLHVGVPANAAPGSRAAIVFLSDSISAPDDKAFWPIGIEVP